jgi:ubiquinone/menaquinone biosynthesis C-methylase UbiE
VVLRGRRRFTRFRQLTGRDDRSWANRSFLRGSQYKTDTNLTARQSIYAYQHPRIDLAARVLDLAAPGPSATIADVGCGNGIYLAELVRRGFGGRVLGVDLSLGMLAAARERLNGIGSVGDASAPDGSTESTSSVALANADATALPLRDGVADLALAPHMLYHVPEPADALRELRRVTRPGGRVVIVLNGAVHLRQLRAAVAAARGDDAKAMGERVTLDNGESLARSFFPNVTRHDFVAELRVPAPGPIADYLRSVSGTSHQVDSEHVIETVVTALPRTPEGHYLITSHTGCLIGEL